MSSKEYKSGDIRFAWRLLAGPAIGQLFGLVIGNFVILDSTNFLSAWNGAAAGTCLGFWYGLYWHLKDPNRRRRKSLIAIVFIGLICNSLGLAVVSSLYGNVGFSNSLDQLKSLKAGQIKKITIMDNFETIPLLTIDDARIIVEFSSASQDSKKYIPKSNYNPNVTFYCYVELSGFFPYGLSIDIFEGDLNRIICTFAKRAGKSTSYHGTFESNGLRVWFDKYVVSKIKEET